MLVALWHSPTYITNNVHKKKIMDQCAIYPVLWKGHSSPIYLQRVSQNCILQYEYLNMCVFGN